MSEELITIASFGSEFEAEIVKGKLQASGIDSFLFKDDCGGMRPHMQLTAGVQLKVKARDYDEAKNILRDEVEDVEETQNPEDEIIRTIQNYLYKARGWILVGFVIIPGWFAFPFSFIFATKASSIYKIKNINDQNLKNKILRLRLISAVFTLVFWIVSIFYIFSYLTNR